MSAARTFNPRLLLLSATSGLVSAAIDIPLSISLAVLIFSGGSEGDLAAGIGLLLTGAVLVSVIVSLASSFQASIAVPQDAPAVLLALLAASLAANAAAGSSVFSTVAVTIILTSLFTGLAFLLLGVFRLGDLVRFIPYPVIGGFLAGTGWLLCRGALGVMTGMEINLAGFTSLFQAGVVWQWLLGVSYGVLLLVLLRRYSHFLLVPALVLGSVLLTHFVMRLAGYGTAGMRSLGMLLGPFPAGGLWSPFDLSQLGLVDWPAILSNLGSIATTVLLCVVSLLLNASGLELATRQEIDLNRELRAGGLANLAAGLVGSPPGYTALSLSMLGHRLGANSRLNGLVFAALCALTVLAGAPLLALIPKFVVGGLLFYLGLSFLVEWLIDAWFKLSRADYAVVLVMLATVAVFGPLQGVGLGVALSSVMFIYEYSKTRVIKHTLTSKTYRSSVERSPDQKTYLSGLGEWLLVMELQGFLFFGTANRLYEAIRSHIQNPQDSPPRFIVLDFRLVTGLDGSASISFARLIQLASPLGIVLVFTNLPPAIRHKLSKDALTPEAADSWQAFPDLDHGIEYCEDRVLKHMVDPQQAAGPATLSRSRIALDGLLRSSLRGLLKQMFVDSGTVLIQQGDAPKGLYFIDYGQLTAFLELPSGERMRLRSMGPGNIVGEMGLYMNQPASATVEASDVSVLYFLPGDELRELEGSDPQTAAELHRFMVRLVSERLQNTLATLQALSQ